MTTHLALILLTALGLLVACDQQPSTPPDQVPLEVAPIKIVSLAPALTQMINDIGEAGSIVGVAQNDDCAPVDAKVVGNYVEVNFELLASLNPTHVFMMTGKEGVPERLSRLAASNSFELVAYKYPNTIDEVGQILFDDQTLVSTQPSLPTTRALGEALDRGTEAQTVRYRMHRQLHDLGDLTTSAKHPRVLMVIAVNPVMASGPRTVLDQLLTRSVGAINAAGEASVQAPTFDKEKLTQLKPEVILYFEPKGAPLGSVDEDSRLADFRGLDIPAVTENRIHLIADPQALLPSTNLPRVAAAMTKAVHPSLADKVDRILAPTQAGMGSTPADDASNPPTSQPAE